MERKLTAILCADVFGYSRLMWENEEATLRTLSSHRKALAVNSFERTSITDSSDADDSKLR